MKVLKKIFKTSFPLFLSTFCFVVCSSVVESTTLWHSTMHFRVCNEYMTLSLKECSDLVTYQHPFSISEFCTTTFSLYNIASEASHRVSEQVSTGHKMWKKFVHFSLTIFSHTKINFRIWDFLEKKLWQFSVKIQMELFRPFLKLCGFVLFSNSRCMTKSMLGDHNPLKSWNNTQDAVHPWSAQHFQVSKYSKFFDLLAFAATLVSVLAFARNSFFRTFRYV